MRNKNRKNIIILVMAGLILFGGGIPFGATSGCAAAQKTITIGLMSCISGPQAVIGNACKFGAEQAVEYVNKEKLLGPDLKLKLIVVDDQLNATVGLSSYQGFKDKVVAFAGFDTSGCSALRPFVEQDKKPFLALTTNRTFIYPPSQYVFGVAPPYEELLVGFLEAIKAGWKEQRPPKIGFISFETPSGIAAISAAKKFGPKIGWDIGPICVVPPTSVDFSDAIAKIKDEKPDWVLLSLTGGQIKNVLSQAEATHVKEMTKWLLPLWGGFSDSTKMVLSEGQLEGIYGFCLTSNPDVQDGAKKWATWTKENSGKACDEAGNSGAIGVFIITEAIKKTLEKVGIEKLNGPNLSKYGFQQINNFQVFGDLMPPITYGPDVSRGSKSACLFRMVNGQAQEAMPWFNLPTLDESK